MNIVDSKINFYIYSLHEQLTTSFFFVIDLMEHWAMPDVILSRIFKTFTLQFFRVGHKNAFHMLNPLFYWTVFRVTIRKFELLSIVEGFDGLAVFIFAICV